MIDFVVGHGPAFYSRDFLYNSAGSANALQTNLLMTVPWVIDYSWQGTQLCEQAVLQSPRIKSAQPVVVRNVQAYVSLKIAVAALEKLSQKTDWLVNEQKVTDWKEMLRNPSNIPEFRRALAQEIKKTQGCQFGDYLWPISFDSAGQNQISPLLVKMSGGKLVAVFPKK